MKIIQGSNAFPKNIASPVVTMGNFDGVHLGHRHLFETANRIAGAVSGISVVYTFDPHPVRLLSPTAAPKLLQTPEQKLAAIEAAGIAMCVIEPFTHAFAASTPETFFEEIIQQRLHAPHVIVGYDFTFGAQRRGTAELLKQLGKAAHIEVTIIEAQFADGMLISSSNIRKQIAAGDMEQAAVLLGRPYELVGTVVRGRGLGESLGAHTANMKIENELIPRDGIYLSNIIVEGNRDVLPSITSIGDNPTFPGAAHTVETHILDQQQNVLGKHLRLELLEWMREQIRFDHPESLKQQIAADLDAARRRHARRKR
ncbi:MAG: bifunctional riboflavin kinase/FAD synthetase [Deltaproteobacteria bacterium]|nr:bifunctional riboflavin kinase/FAD synthetase [Deltaproteobacteria bacterium]